VARQTVSPWEVIVINDGSTDASIERIAASGLDVRLIHTGGLGGAAARNAGIGIAQGEWLAFLDADDIWYENHLLRARDLIRQHDAAGYINHYDRVSLEGETLQERASKIASVVVGFGLGQYLDLYRKYGNFVGMSACVVSRHAVLEIGGLDETQTRRHDIEFWLRFVRNRTWVFDPVASSAYRCDNPNGLSSKKANAELHRFIAFLKQRDAGESSASFSPLLKSLAKSTLSKSYHFGNHEDQIRAHELAYKHLGHGDRILFWMASRSPMIRDILKTKRWI
jgi:glycosyltransferase involved in cell wall biosynthesis